MLSTQFRVALRWLSTAAAETHRYPFPAASEFSSVPPRGASSTTGEGRPELLAPLVMPEATQHRVPLTDVRAPKLRAGL
jgi:hypothetical protein